MGFEGLRTFTGDEVGNLVIGQMGFAVVDCKNGLGGPGTNDVGTHSNGTAGAAHTDRTFIAIKVMKDGSTDDVGFIAETLLGDPLTIESVSDGDIIYGPFSYVQGTNSAALKGHLICYFGNSK